MPNLLELTLFGSPEVRRHGQPVTGFRSSKTQALLYYLAVTDRPHTRPTLTGLFWGDQPEAAARTSLSKCLSNLRDLVGDAVLVDRQTVAFNRNQPYHLDIEHFLAGINQPPTAETLHAWQAALTLYRGDFLEGFYVRDAPDFEQWVLVQRAHYREAVMQGLHTLANYADQQGDLSQAITHTRRLLTLEPWREEAHRQLMIRLARSGQRAAALAQFETCRRVLDEELAVEPDVETVALVEAIRSGEFDTMTSDKVKVAHPVTLSPRSAELGGPLGAKPHPVIPTPPTPLIGRERELSELNELIGNPQCRLITISGAGGMGKTRLALAAAAAQNQKFPHSMVFVPLAGVSSAHFLPQAILAALNLPLQGTLAPQQQLRTALYPQERWLLLDNYEHLLPNVDLLLDMLHHAPHLKFLVTSRERLALQAEHLYELTGLDYPLLQTTQQTTQTVTTYTAIQLFLQRLRQIQPRYTPNTAEMKAIARICQIAEGMPLALELVAGSLRMQSPLLAVAALEAGQAPALLPLRDLAPRHASLGSVFAHSWNLLSQVEQQVLRRVAVFRGCFSAEAAQAVVGLVDSEMTDILAALVDKSLLRFHAATGYDMHELVRQCAMMQLQAAGEQRVVQQRHLEYFVALTKQANQFLWTADYRVWWQRLQSAYSDLREALTRALQPNQALFPLLPAADDWQLIQRGVDLCNGLFRFWTWRSAFSEGYDWCKLALEQQQMLAADQQPLIAAARLWLNLGIFAAYLQRPDEATDHVQSALTLFRHLNDPIGIGDCLLCLGIYSFDRHEIAQARQQLQEAQRIFERERYQYGIYYVNGVLGEVDRYCNDYPAARHACQLALQSAEAISYQRGVAVVLINLTFVENRLGALSVALTTIQRSLQIFVELDDHHHIAACLLAIGCVFSQASSSLAHTQAATFFGASDHLFASLNSEADTADLAEKVYYVTLLRQQLGEAGFVEACQSGQQLELAHMLKLAQVATLKALGAVEEA